jgi:hypothetical protein
VAKNRIENDPTLKTGAGYDWTIFSYVEMPIALLIGSLNALGTSSSSSYCSRYTLSARQLALEAGPYFEAGSPSDGYQNYHDSISYLDNIAISCYKAFSNEISIDHIKGLVDPWYGIPVNLLYNLGYMWIDYFNYRNYTYLTVPQQDWSFFLFFQVGDFFMRFLFNSSDASS